MTYSSGCVGGGDVSDLVPVVDTGSVHGQIGSEALQGVPSAVLSVLVVVDSAVLTSQVGSFVHNSVELGDADVAPVRDLSSTH